MKTKVILLAILSLGFIFTSCQKDEFDIVPSTNVTTTNFSASGVSQLDVSNLFKVYVSFSETEESVQVEANENLHSLIEMSQSGSKLIVGLQRNTSISGAPVLNVYVKTSTIENITAEGAAGVEFENTLNGGRLDLDFSGASTFKGSLNVDEFISYLNGASKMSISGNSNSFDVKANGASEMTGFGFQCNSLKADLEGGSNISLTVNQKLDVSASGASKIYYKGSGVIENQVLKDASEIVKMD